MTDPGYVMFGPPLICFVEAICLVMISARPNLQKRTTWVASNAVKDFLREKTGLVKGIAGQIDSAIEPRMWRQVVATGASPWLEK
jgi:hypothetical protein